jgi:hypothetical protein
VSLVDLPHIYLVIYILACFCHIGGATWLLVFVKCRHSILIKELILKSYTKFEFKSNKQTRRRRRGESLPGKTGGTGFGQCAYSAAQALVRDSGLFRNSGEKSGVSGSH